MQRLDRDYESGDDEYSGNGDAESALLMYFTFVRWESKYLKSVNHLLGAMN